MISIYEIEDELLFFLRNNITEFYLEEFSKSLNKPLSETLNALFEFSKIEKHKLHILYETRCPYCNTRVGEYEDFLNVRVGNLCRCDSCGDFIKEKNNTYIFFRLNSEWVNTILELDRKKKTKNNNIKKVRIKSEEDIILQLNKILLDLESLPNGSLSIEGKIVRSQINTYLKSKIK